MRNFKSGHTVLVLLLAAVLVAACTDSQNSSPAAPQGPALAKSTLTSDSGTVVTRIDPLVGGSVVFGTNRLFFGDHVVCDPATSGYGVDTWDQPCTLATAPFDLKVVWHMEGNNTVAEFSPDLRFVAADSMRYWAYLTLSEHKIDATKYNNIFWRNPATGGWVDESKADTTLKPYTNQQRDEVTRRIRHLSGYATGVGVIDGAF